MSSPHHYLRGGNLPLGFRRTWAPPTGGGRPVVAGYEIDPTERALASELWRLAAAGYSVRKVAAVMSAQFRRSFWPMQIHRTLHHPLFSDPPDESLRIVPADVVMRARAGLRRRKGGRRSHVTWQKPQKQPEVLHESRSDRSEVYVSVWPRQV